MDDECRHKIEELNIKQVKTDLLLDSVDKALFKFNKNTEDIIRITEKVKLIDKHEDFLVNDINKRIIDVSSKEFINYLNTKDVRDSLANTIDGRVDEFHTKVYNKMLLKAIGLFSAIFSILFTSAIGFLKWLI